MSEDLLAFNDEDNVSESLIIDDFSHVLDQGVHSLIVNLVFFQFSYV